MRQAIMKTLRRTNVVLTGFLLINCFFIGPQFPRIKAQESELSLAELPETRNCSQQNDFFECLSKYNPLKFETGELKWFKTSDLKRLAKKVSKPKPVHAKGTTIVTVEIIIDTRGEVVCSRATSGHPLVRVSTLNAIEKWKFNPYKVDKKPTAIAGRISFKFEGNKVYF